MLSLAVWNRGRLAWFIGPKFVQITSTKHGAFYGISHYDEFLVFRFNTRSEGQLKVTPWSDCFINNKQLTYNNHSLQIDMYMECD